MEANANIGTKLAKQISLYTKILNGIKLKRKKSVNLLVGILHSISLSSLHPRSGQLAGGLPKPYLKHKFVS